MKLNQKIYSEWWLTSNFQQSYSPTFDGIITLHHDILVYLVIIMAGLVYILLRLFLRDQFNNGLVSDIAVMFKNKLIDVKNMHNYMDMDVISEFIWTILPLFILVFMGTLTMSFLYSVDNYLYFPASTITVTGHQWYWSYDYNDFNVYLDSYMIPTEYLHNGELRLLEVDNRLLVPAQTHLRIFVTSDDVIHSWSIPSLGIKMDASPGRMNHCHLFVNKIGIFYGQCSELCGIGHSFMPIVVQALPTQFFNYLFINSIL